MDKTTLITQIFEVCLIPLLSVLTTYFIKWINAKAENIKTQTNNELANKYITFLDKIITESVISINQTYVEALKKENKFDLESQKVAFAKCYEMILLSLTEEANTVLTEVIGDLNSYITNKIETEVVTMKRGAI